MDLLTRVHKEISDCLYKIAPKASIDYVLENLAQTTPTRVYVNGSFGFWCDSEQPEQDNELARLREENLQLKEDLADARVQIEDNADEDNRSRLELEDRIAELEQELEEAQCELDEVKQERDEFESTIADIRSVMG